jgi:glycosyltransferase involved in cell wall biosynthesis
VPDLNGGAYFTHRLAVGLNSAGHNVLVICPSRSGRDEQELYEGINLSRFSSFATPLYPDFRVINPIGLNKRVKAVISDFAPDIIHLQGKFILGNAVFKQGKILGIPMVATNHLTPQNFEHHFRIPKMFRKLYYKLVWNWAFSMLRQVKYVTTPTKSGAEEMKRNGFEKEVIPVSCGIDASVFFPGSVAEHTRKKYHLPNLPIVLFTGRQDKDKNLDVVLRGVKLALEYVDFHTVLTGKGAYENTIKQLATSLGLKDKVTFTGQIPDDEFPEIYRMADVFVNACEVELQCISGLEAVASGMPVVLANALALPELIDPRDPNGFLFAPKDHEMLSKHLVTLIENEKLRKEMGANSLKVAAHHAMAQSIETFTALYTKALN